MKTKLFQYINKVIINVLSILTVFLFLLFQPYLDFVFNNYQQIVLNENINKEIEISDTSFIVKTKEKKFYNKIEELLYLKYPSFIAELLLNNKNSWVYTLNEEYLIINFNIKSQNKIINELDLIVYYDEIEEYINIVYDKKYFYKNEDGFDYNKDKKTIAFTFDDGPHPEYTRKILELLKDNKSTATFFLIGDSIKKYPEVAKILSESNNEVGTHSSSHRNFYKLKETEILNDVKSSIALYKSITGDTINLLRPPYGNIRKKTLNDLKMPIILWNVDTNDWKYRDTNYIINHVVENVQDGDIILFHDVYLETYEAVKVLLPKLYLMGYQVVDVSTLSKLKDSPLEESTLYYFFK